MRHVAMTLAIAAVLGSAGVAAAQTPTAPSEGAPVPTTTTATSTTTTTTPAPGVAPVPVAAAPPPAAVVTTSAAVDADPAPPATGAGETTTTTSYVNRPLLVSGLILFGGTYGASAIDVATSSRQVDKNNLEYPVVGPWMDYGKRGGCPQEGSCGRETGNKVLLILDGVGQGIGAISVLSSFFISEKTTRSWWLIGDGRSFQAAPTTVGTGYGLGAVGSF